MQIFHQRWRRSPVPWAALAAALALLTPDLGVARAWRLGALTIDQAWARPALAGRAGAGYLSVTNTGRAADSLVAASSPAAARVTLHEMRMAGSIMSMKAVAALPVPPGATLTLAPGRYHLMLEGLKRELKVGERVPATLTFARAGRIQVEFVVQAAAPGHSGHM